MEKKREREEMSRHCSVLMLMQSVLLNLVVSLQYRKDDEGGCFCHVSSGSSVGLKPVSSFYPFIQARINAKGCARKGIWH